MDYREPRPPRSVPPRGTPSAAPPAYPDNHYSDRPPATPSSRGNVSFQVNERGDRHQALDDGRQRYMSAYREGPLPPTPSDLSNAEAGGSFDTRVGRKKSLVRPDREKIEPGHRLWHYRTHAAQLEEEKGNLGLMPSCTLFLYDFNLLKLVLMASKPLATFRRGRLYVEGNPFWRAMRTCRNRA